MVVSSPAIASGQTTGASERTAICKWVAARCARPCLKARRRGIRSISRGMAHRPLILQERVAQPYLELVFLGCQRGTTIEQFERTADGSGRRQLLARVAAEQDWISSSDRLLLTALDKCAVLTARLDVVVGDRIQDGGVIQRSVRRDAG